MINRTNLNILTKEDMNGNEYRYYDYSEYSDEQLHEELMAETYYVNFNVIGALSQIIIDLRTALRAYRAGTPIDTARDQFKTILIQRMREGLLIPASSCAITGVYNDLITGSDVSRFYPVDNAHLVVSRSIVGTQVYTLVKFASTYGRVILVPSLEHKRQLNTSTVDLLYEFVIQKICVVDSPVRIFRNTTQEERAINAHPDLPREKQLGLHTRELWGTMQLYGYVYCSTTCRYLLPHQAQKVWSGSADLFASNQYDLCDYIKRHTDGRNTPRRYPYSTDVINHLGMGHTHHKIQAKPIYVGIELETSIPHHQGEVPAPHLVGQSYLDVLRICEIQKTAFRRNTVWNMRRYRTFGAIPTLDGSLDANGVEWIFRPESINGMRTNVQNFVKAYGDQHDYDATRASDEDNSYGLHVHVSSEGTIRKKITQLRIAAVAHYLTDFIYELGGREPNGYCFKPSKIKLGEPPSFSRTSVMRDGTSNNLWLFKRYICDDITNRIGGDLFSSRYYSLNLSNPRTIEYRFPKCLIDEEHIMRNVEFAHALTMFSAYHVMSIIHIKRVSPADMLAYFEAYVMDNYKQYPSLTQFLIHRHLRENNISTEEISALEYTPTNVHASRFVMDSY